MYTDWYTNADLKISLYVCVYIKIKSWKFCILNPTICELLTCKVCKIFVYKHIEVIE